jgi:hypothetical protein
MVKNGYKIVVATNLDKSKARGDMTLSRMTLNKMTSK